MAKRRGHGEGSIHLRDDGRWCASIDLGYRNGRRRRKHIYGKTRKEVAEKLKVALRDQQRGVLNAGEDQTIGEFLDAWLEQNVKVTNKPSTYKSYKDLVERHIKPAIGKVKLTKLTPQHVQELLVEVQEKGLSARTTQYVRAVLHHALEQAMKWDLVARNVASVVDPPRVERHKVEPLTEEQARKLLEAVAGHRLEALYAIALGLGLRRGEVLALRWADIDLKAVTLQVSEGKTASSTRKLPLPATLAEALTRQRARVDKERAELGEEWQEHDLVFPSEVGTPIEPRNLLRHFKGVLRRVELPETVRFHDLRHSCATFLIAQGVHPRVVMEILGHSQISVTMNTYGHVLPESQQDAVGKIDMLLHRHEHGEEPGEA